MTRSAMPSERHTTSGRHRRRGVWKLSLFASAAALCALVVTGNAPSVQSPEDERSLLINQTQAQADRKSAGCITCHVSVDEPTMHETGTVRLGCVDCHTGDPTAALPAGAAAGSGAYEDAKHKAHPQPSLPELWRSSANPVRPFAKWLKESPDYIQFVNPGDLRVAEKTCGQSGCHSLQLHAVRTSMMTHGGMLWGAALYNNGAVLFKNPRFGESYSLDGTPQRIRTWPEPSGDETRSKGVLPYLDPLERWEISQPGNILRVFERGGGTKAEIGNPDRSDDNGEPDDKLGNRGFGTQLRTDPVFLGLQKTRLLDPLLYQPGTNDQPGDYRASGCSGCHVIYANDRSPLHSAQYARYGNMGTTAQADSTIPRGESGHPIFHKFTRAIPSSQCMVCHVHPGTNMVTTYYGDTWWDNEVDGEFMYPKKQRRPSPEEEYEVRVRNPEAAASLGLWGDAKFLAQVGSPEFNAKLKHTQFDDFHSHGWIFRQVFKHDRVGNLLDADGKIVSFDDPEKLKKAVHLMDIHLEKGMQCIDCHFEQDSHGNGKIYQEPRAAIEVGCVDCHGTIRHRATLITSGPAAPAGGSHLERLRTPWGKRQFYSEGDKVYQQSMMQPDLRWEITQVLDSITPGNPHYNEQSRLAKTMRADGRTWGDVPGKDADLAHGDGNMTCVACHTSWTPSCFGCHLSMTANRRMPMLHNEGLMTRNWTAYNFQVLRDDLHMLGIDGSVTGHRVAPVRSSCAILVSSQNADREWLYYQQQTISAEGFSGAAFSTFVPHTVRAAETRRCGDCHISQAKDNNAWMAQLMLLGTNFVNFMGRYIYVAEGKGGYHAVVVAEHSDPDAVVGSDLERIAYPENFERFVQGHRELKTAYEHKAGEVLDVQLRGEYLYAALGKGGFRAYDVANIDNKGFSERMVTAPVSPFGQRLYVKTKYATAVATPTTLGVDPLRRHDPVNEEQPIHLIYGFLYVTDKYEGLVVIGNPDLKSKTPGVGTLLNGNPEDNFLKRALAFNPDGILSGARRITIAGTYAYILCDRGLVVVDINNPLEPRIVAQIGAPDLVEPQGVAIQFRYAFVVDRQGLKVLDVTSLDRPRMVPGAFVPLEDARNVYVARTYAYVSGGKQGVAIVNVERPEQPVLDQIFTAGGQINDTRDIKIGATASSLFAYVADGHNGLRVIQLISPEDNPYFNGFSPRPKPTLIATFHTHEPALMVSKGQDRDRAVDEGGNQLAVFGRRGARPFNLEEMRRLYLMNGELYTVADQPPGEPRAFSTGESWLDRLWAKLSGR